MEFNSRNFKIEVAALSDTGKVRKVDEDSYLIEGVCGDESSLLLAVADGMGGLSKGEVASQLATEALKDKKTLFSNTKGEDEIFAHLKEIYKEANRKVVEYSKSKNFVRGMGTTLTSCVIKDNKLYVANVGDSRIYLFRGPDVFQLTEDHSYVAEQVKKGVLTYEEAEASPLKNVVTRAIGAEQDVDVDTFGPFELHINDKVVLCCDGLYNMVKEDEISYVLHTYEDPELAASQLVNKANMNGGLDNITVIIADLRKKELAGEKTVNLEEEHKELLRNLRKKKIRKMFFILIPLVLILAFGVILLLDFSGILTLGLKDLFMKIVKGAGGK